MDPAEVEKKIGKGKKRKTYGGEVVYMYKDKLFEVNYNTENDDDMGAQLKSILITDFDD